ncbi:MAG: hypothetical protein IKK51_07035 [Oscillospiraceae bacterium]|nr:hypothetical protein [Oscillospiraceae bacterium]MBR4101614.1 hypothetical protein [Oscillospiraceae bacterium]MBR6618207.1 hypothetical protein [Oscillospiraceae bacterium]
MQNAEPPTKVYHPKPTDPERITQLALSDAPIRIYQPQNKINNAAQ